MDALCAMSPIPLLVAPPIGLKLLCDAVLVAPPICATWTEVVLNLSPLRGRSGCHRQPMHLRFFRSGNATWALWTAMFDNAAPTSLFGSGCLHQLFCDQNHCASTAVLSTDLKFWRVLEYHSWKCASCEKWGYELNSSPMKLKLLGKFNDYTIKLP